MCANDSDDDAGPGNIIERLARGGERINTLTKAIGVLALAFAVGTVLLAWRMGSDSTKGLWWVVLIAFGLSLAAMLAAILILARRIDLGSPDSPDGAPTSPDQPETVFNLRYFRSEQSRRMAEQFNSVGAKDTAEARFLVEVLVHRLNMLGAREDIHGYSIIRHATAIPDTREERVEQIMGDDYAAIMDAGVETAASQDGKPKLDTLIFRDVELWRHPEYWKQNEPLADKATLRRLFLYEDSFFLAENAGMLDTSQQNQLVGLFCGALVHDSHDWDWRPLNASAPPLGVEIEHLFGPEEPELEFQSSAAFAEHTVVFIHMKTKPYMLLHRFYSDAGNPTSGKVVRYGSAFTEAFSSKRIKPHTASELHASLRKLHDEVESRIDKAFEDAKHLVAGSYS